MQITKVIVKNYRSLRYRTVVFNKNLNIIVGDNESGKSTLLEAVNLALTGLLNGRPIYGELHPFLFNMEAVQAFLADYKASKPSPPPEILIEVYFANEPELADLKGTNNSLEEDVPGVSMTIAFNDAYSEEFNAYMEKIDEVRSLPVEYYRSRMADFKDHEITSRSIPTKTTLIDASAIRNLASGNKYIIDMIKDVLSPKQMAQLALSYRKMKETFLSDSTVGQVNTHLAGKKGEISDKTISVSLDNSSRGNWEMGIMPHLNEVPISLVGKGEQNSVKIKLAMAAAAKTHLFLIEEPENHLSFTNLNTLIASIAANASERQTIITTHSSFVLNKLGIENVILFTRTANTRMNTLKPKTYDYFMKLPGHDTLRMILANRAILVEGPSDELVVQRAFHKAHGTMPLEAGVDVISVNSLAFKRFLEIAVLLGIRVAVVTDNDGDVAGLKEKYKDYFGKDKMLISFDADEAAQTMEPQLVRDNGKDKIEKILGRVFPTVEDLEKWMSKNKTQSALKLFDTAEDWVVPDYIANAVK
ncbi:ATP-dependent nuclease [Rhizobium sp. SRDI969]|uniref:ATP-dependent nuclease n=1 Tax=Rhizobium sp. SRDI969 TaxID=3138252 RepID=UPI0021A6B7D1|nr:AAA family ATPase [Rhizobium leguminosarum]UWM84946.1 AAA family ATPase [Rhizobium leguminosarum bv. viciae]